jgi:hypothetical protein
MLPLVVVILPVPETSRPALLVPTFAPVPLTMIFPELVETVALLPLIKIPRPLPKVDPVPVRVIAPMPVEVMLPAVSTEIPVVPVLFPLPVPVTLIAPFREVMIVLDPLTTTPRQSLVPKEELPVNVIGAVLVEVMLAEPEIPIP